MSDKIKIPDLFSKIPSELAFLFRGAEYPWDVLSDLAEYLEGFIASRPEGYTELCAGVLIGEGADISADAVILPPTVIGGNATIRCGAYIRGSVFVGEGAVIGHCSEVKNSIIMSGAQVPHFNYVGDSILGYRAHLGAGVVLSNLKADKTPVTVKGEQIFESGRRKLGAILGDGAEIGCNCVLNPGTVIGRGSRVYPCVSFRGILPDGHIAKSDGSIIKMRRDISEEK